MLTPANAQIPGGGTLQITQAAAFSGPLPPPNVLQRYDEIIPNGADRIVAMAEKQSAHRIDLERTVIHGDSRRANWGVFCGFTLAVLVIVLSFILILYGHAVAGTILGTLDLVSLISVFIYGTTTRRRERTRREERNRELLRRR